MTLLAISVFEPGSCSEIEAPFHRFAMHDAMMRSIANRYFHERGEDKDFYQELKIHFAKLAIRRPSEEFSEAFVFKVAVNLAKKTWQRKNVQLSREAEYLEEHSHIEARQVFDQIDTRDHLEFILASIPDDDRELLELQMRCGDAAECAEVLGIDVAEWYRQFSRAIKRARRFAFRTEDPVL